MTFVIKFVSHMTQISSAYSAVKVLIARQCLYFIFLVFSVSSVSSVASSYVLKVSTASTDWVFISQLSVAKPIKPSIFYHLSNWPL